MNWIQKFNTWYDGLQEPTRFIVAMTLTMAGIVAITPGKGLVAGLGALYLIVLVLVRMSAKWRKPDATA